MRRRCSGPRTWALTRSAPGGKHMARCAHRSPTTAWWHPEGDADVARILLDGVTKVFGSDVVAVDHVSMDIADGEFMVLVGPSGCGKSTLLRMIAGIETASSGQILIDGTD